MKAFTFENDSTTNSSGTDISEKPREQSNPAPTDVSVLEGILDENTKWYDSPCGLVPFMPEGVGGFFIKNWAGSTFIQAQQMVFGVGILPIIRGGGHVSRM